MPPTLTVLMTTYHGTSVEELERSIASITGQTRPPEEFLVVVDGPVPQPLDDALAAATAAHPGIRVERLPRNVGSGLASARGLELATGDFLARHDSDDVSLPHRLERQMAAIHDRRPRRRRLLDARVRGHPRPCRRPAPQPPDPRADRRQDAPEQPHQQPHGGLPPAAGTRRRWIRGPALHAGLRPVRAAAGRRRPGREPRRAAGALQRRRRHDLAPRGLADAAQRVGRPAPPARHRHDRHRAPGPQHDRARRLPDHPRRPCSRRCMPCCSVEVPTRPPRFTGTP